MNSIKPIARLWNRYQNWRSTSAVTMSKQVDPVCKIAMDTDDFNSLSIFTNTES